MALSVAYPLQPHFVAEPMADLQFQVPSSWELIQQIKTEVDSWGARMDCAEVTTYTDLSSPVFSQLKQGEAELFRAAEGSTNLVSWIYKHPEHWGAMEVLDWVYSSSEENGFNGSIFRGEAFQKLTGKQLCSMNESDFKNIDENYGPQLYLIFRKLLEGVSFQKPKPIDTFKPEMLGNVPDFSFLGFEDEVTDASYSTPEPAPIARSPSLTVFSRESNEVTVALEGLGIYPISVDTDMKISCYEPNNDMDSSSDSDFLDTKSLSSPENLEQDDSDEGIVPDFIENKLPTIGEDNSFEEEDKRHCRQKRPPSTSKGNHLWEFVRDLLKDSHFNPSLLKWEDKDQGVFKFVQSEAVAQMWGRKKNNPGMTYEKLSRAMRFCRSAGYFDSVPKTGRFPKKLCFKFGQKAHGWRE